MRAQLSVGWWKTAWPTKDLPKNFAAMSQAIKDVKKTKSGLSVIDHRAALDRLLGAADGAPLQLNAIASTIAETNGAGFDIEAARAALAETEETFEPFKARMHALALQRAVADAYKT